MILTTFCSSLFIGHLGLFLLSLVYSDFYHLNRPFYCFCFDSLQFLLRFVIVTFLRLVFVTNAIVLVFFFLFVCLFCFVLIFVLFCFLLCFVFLFLFCLFVFVLFFFCSLPHWLTFFFHSLYFYGGYTQFCKRFRERNCRFIVGVVVAGFN